MKRLHILRAFGICRDVTWWYINTIFFHRSGFVHVPEVEINFTSSVCCLAFELKSSWLRAIISAVHMFSIYECEKYFQSLSPGSIVESWMRCEASEAHVMITAKFVPSTINCWFMLQMNRYTHHWVWTAYFWEWSERTFVTTTTQSKDSSCFHPLSLQGYDVYALQKLWRARVCYILRWISLILSPPWCVAYLLSWIIFPHSTRALSSDVGCNTMML